MLLMYSTSDNTTFRLYEYKIRDNAHYNFYVEIENVIKSPANQFRK